MTTSKQMKSGKPKPAKAATKEEKSIAPVAEAAKPAPKPRKSRAKPKPTKEEMLKMLTESCNAMKQIIQELKEE